MSTTTIGLVELGFHNEVLRSYIIALLQTDFKIVIFTNEFNYNQIYDFNDHEDLVWQVKGSKESHEKFLESSAKSVQGCDLIIATTLPRDPFFVRYKFPVKSILLIHDCHYYFEPRKHFTAASGMVDNTRDLLKIIRHFLFGERRKNRKLIKQFDHLAVPSQHVMDYLKEKDYFSDFPIDLVLDFAIHDSSFKKKEASSDILITIPGTVDNQSRDYHLLYESLSKLKDELNTAITVCILGRPKRSVGRKHIKELRQLNGDKLKIITYDSFVDQKEFDEVMSKTSFLLIPTLEHMKYEVCLEKSGYSSVTGNINDLVKYGLPAIMTHYYPLPDVIEKMVKRNNLSYDLAKDMNDWIESGEYLKIRQDSSAILKEINEVNMGSKFHAELLKLR